MRISAISQIGALLSLLLQAEEAAGAGKGQAAAGAAGEAGEARSAPAAGEAVEAAVGEAGDRHETTAAGFVGTICAMARLPSCHKRANFVHICTSLVRGLTPRPHPLITQSVLPCLETLVTDRVANVRLPVFLDALNI